MTTPEQTPAPPKQQCTHSGCTETPVIQWSRRPTEQELADLIAAERTRQTELGLPPEQHRIPSVDDTVIAVFSCADHAIDIDLAARVHAADCRAPHDEHLPGCDCEPEALPEPEPPHADQVTLPTGWTITARRTS